MIEVEVKLPVEDLNEIKRKLVKIGFEASSFIEERDTYFDNQQGDIRATMRHCGYVKRKITVQEKSGHRLISKGRGWTRVR